MSDLIFNCCSCPNFLSLPAMGYFISLFFGFSFSFIFLFSFVPRLRLSFIDLPNERSSHSTPTPRGGGTAFVLAGAISSFVFFLLFFLSDAVVPRVGLSSLVALPLSIVGFIDDKINLPVGLRYLVQLSTSLLLVGLSPLLNISSVPFLVFPLLIIAVTAVINFTNFMDGLDGLVAGSMAVLISSAAIQFSAPWPIWTLVGALLGFLLWNWSPAKIFMGDVGSTFLGAVFAMLLLQASTWSEALALLLVATPLLGDACVCVLRRLIARQQVFHAHRLHLYQRLHQAGWPHARVSSLYISASAVLALAFLRFDLPWVTFLAVLELLLGIWLDQNVAVPFSLASRS